MLVYNATRDAYLFDTASSPAFDPVALGSGVTDVQWQMDTQGTLSGVLIVLRDGSYRMFDPNGRPKGQVVFSADRATKVNVSGENRDAFLYSTAQPPAFEPVFLGTKVQSVRYQTQDDGTQSIAVTLEDGEVHLFDQAGKPTAQILYSPDRTRRVEIGGENRDAAMYDASSQPAMEPVSLGTKVQAAQFQQDEQGRLVVSVLYDDGSSTTFDAQGSAIGNQPKPTGDQPAGDEAKAEKAKSKIEKAMEKSPTKKALESGFSW